MRERDQLRKHAAYLDRMAGAVGLDLQEAAIRGHLPLGELAEAVIRCSDCARVSDCEGWLGNRSAPGGLPPQYCMNRRLLERLSDPCFRAQIAESEGSLA